MTWRLYDRGLPINQQSYGQGTWPTLRRVREWLFVVAPCSPQKSATHRDFLPSLAVRQPGLSTFGMYARYAPLTIKRPSSASDMSAGTISRAWADQVLPRAQGPLPTTIKGRHRFVLVSSPHARRLSVPLTSPSEEGSPGVVRTRCPTPAVFWLASFATGPAGLPQRGVSTGFRKANLLALRRANGRDPARTWKRSEKSALATRRLLSSLQ